MLAMSSPDEDALEAALGLGELAGLTVSNDAEGTYDVSIILLGKDSWNNVFL